MTLMIVGLVVLLGIHLLKPLDLAWRRGAIERIGETTWKLGFTVIALAAFVAIVVGFGAARAHPEVLYVPPAWLRHVNELLTLLAFVLWSAALVPRNHMRAKLGHPLLAGTKAWALGHLLVNGMLHEVVLFGTFLVWAVIAFGAARRRDRRAGVTRVPGTVAGDVATVLVGVALWALFALVLHRWLIGVAPFG